ncbi:tail protein X [Selenomonas sp. AB3002]|uniref:tail protein X n=1 Tax=Selenomonas sp. AB3002 TaxID=1392502 RepID=UPI000496BBF2
MSRTYTTKSGDIWDLIAYEQLGDCKYVNQLMEANPRHLDTGIFSAGVVLTLPEITEDNKVKSLPPWRR